MKNFKKVLAFTLAEVLITLSILGVVAAITVPSLINKNSEREAITKLKKFYSAFTTAYDVAQAEESTNPGTWADQYGSVFGPIVKHLNITKKCSVDDKTCSNNITYKSLNGNSTNETMISPDTNNTIYLLKDGTIFDAWHRINMENDKICKGDWVKRNGMNVNCGMIRVDINGEKQPNRIGVDRFAFYVTDRDIIPAGYKGDTLNPISNCKTSHSSSNTSAGDACTAWALYKGNMDYLRKNVSW